MDVNPKFYDDKRFEKYGLSLKKAKEIGDEIGINWDEVDLGEFLYGVKEEMEHGSEYGAMTRVHDDDFVISGRIALAHLIELPNYYTLLEEMEDKGEEQWEHRDRREWVAEQRQRYQDAWNQATS